MLRFSSQAATFLLLKSGDIPIRALPKDTNKRTCNLDLHTMSLLAGRSSYNVLVILIVDMLFTKQHIYD